MITIVDYGLGNVKAFVNLYKRLNVPARVARQAADLAGSRRIILPGVGAFDHAMELLDGSGMRQTLDELVLERQVPVMGICVGMQILAHGSDEGSRPGLGWIDARVRAFSSQEASAALPLPHMGWNSVSPRVGDPLFAGIEDGPKFYFLHSYYFECTDAASSQVASAHYGIDFCCAVRHKNIAGVQFHPEKSHHWGTALLRNFAMESYTC